MLNQIITVGRIAENNDKMVVAVPRSYKNVNGEYDNDYIKVDIPARIKEKCETLELGCMIGIKGRVHADKNSEMFVVAEKLTYLGGTSKNEE